jgi:hypothetical protein
MLEPPDLYSPVMDLSAVAVEDLLPPFCIAPKPGIYSEQYYFGYKQVNPPSSTQENYTGNGAWAVMQPDGVIVRQAPFFVQASTWTCDATTFNTQTCEALCCEGDPLTVPVLYFAGNGWVIFKPGTCFWKDPSTQITWQIDVQSGSSVFKQ